MSARRRRKGPIVPLKEPDAVTLGRWAREDVEAAEARAKARAEYAAWREKFDAERLAEERAREARRIAEEQDREAWWTKWQADLDAILSDLSTWKQHAWRTAHAKLTREDKLRAMTVANGCTPAEAAAAAAILQKLAGGVR
jgi:hypothetical protein